MATRPMVMRRGAGILAAIGLVALGLQFVLLIQGDGALSFGEVIIRYFSNFTILTSLFAAVSLIAFAIKVGQDEWLVHPFVRTAIAVYSALVFLVYLGALRELWAPQGARWLADTVLHYVVPAGYVVFWLTCVRKAGLRWYDPLLWLIYPLIYVTVILIRGMISGFYPYPFIDAGHLGYAAIAANTAGLVAACAAIGFLFVAAGWSLGRRQKH